MTKPSIRKIITFLDKSAWASADDLYTQPDIQCPICKLLSVYESDKCAHCGYEFTELEKEQQFNKHEKSFIRGSLVGIIFFILLVAFAYMYVKDLI